MTDLPTLDIKVWNTERFQMSRDVSGWASAYSLSSVAWRLQVRKTLSASAVLLDIPTSGSVSYSSGIVVFHAPLSAMKAIPAGDYAFDYGFSPSAGDFIRCEGGLFRVVRGVTR